MSRIAKSPISVPSGVDVKIESGVLIVKGPKGSLTLDLPKEVEVFLKDGKLLVKVNQNQKSAWALAGMVRALANNMVLGVTQGFEKKLILVGVGYRAQAKGKVLGLTVGYSHPVEYELPEGVQVETPSQTEIILKSANKQLLGQVAANVRAYRLPEPYKGKGILYANEKVRSKEAKKK